NLVESRMEGAAMSSPDPFPRPPDPDPARPAEDLPRNGVELCSPEQVLTVLPVEGEPPLTVLPVESSRQPPQPGFWWAVLWSVLYFVVNQGGAVVALVAIMIVEALQTPNPQAYLNSLTTEVPPGQVAVGPGLARILAPAIVFGQVLSILFTLFLLRWIVGPDWKRRLAVRWPSLFHIVLVLLAFPGFLVLPNAVAELVKSVLPTIEYQQQLTSMFQSWSWWVGILAIGVGPGLGEELFCRGFLGRGLVGRYGVTAGILLTSLFFGIMH